MGERVRPLDHPPGACSGASWWARRSVIVSAFGYALVMAPRKFLRKVSSFGNNLYPVHVVLSTKYERHQPYGVTMPVAVKNYAAPATESVSSHSSPLAQETQIRP